MITNIVDHRKNNKQFKEVYGVVEPAHNDNCCAGADKMEFDGRIGFIEFKRTPITYSELLEWASSFDGNNTLYVYSSDPMMPVLTT